MICEDIKRKGIKMRFRLRLFIIFCTMMCGSSPLQAQQRGQYLPGQYGLNAGIMPSPGFSYINTEVNYNISALNDSSGHAVASANTNFNLWVVENVLYYVPNTKFLGGNLGFSIMVPTLANASLVLETPGINGQTTWGLADTWVQPFSIGWHLKRADIQVGDGLVTPTGRYSPGASNNIGSGYWGNDVFVGTTIYLTKNKGTSINYFGDWEVHGQREGTYGTYKTPGQAYSQEWGFGQVLPLSKDFSKLIQLGVIGYDQWQITDNGGTFPVNTPGPTCNLNSQGVCILPASLIPRYSVHAVGGQATFIMPKKDFALWFKYEHEYQAFNRAIGYTMVIGGIWTLRIPKPTAGSSH